MFLFSFVILFVFLFVFLLKTSNFAKIYKSSRSLQALKSGHTFKSKLHSSARLVALTALVSLASAGGILTSIVPLASASPELIPGLGVGVSPLDSFGIQSSVHLSTAIDAYGILGEIPGESAIRLIHHKVGRVIRAIENLENRANDQVEVEWNRVEGREVSGKETRLEIVEIKKLDREISSTLAGLDEFYPGSVVTYTSTNGRKPYTYEGTIKRIFTGDHIEVEWNARNQKQKPLGISYWPSRQFRADANPNAGVVLPDQGKVLMALTSFERGLKEVAPDYLFMLDQIILSRADDVCRISGFQGVAARPSVETRDHHQTLSAYLPVKQGLVAMDFRRTGPWDWTHLMFRTTVAGMGLIGAAAVAGVFLGGFMVAPVVAPAVIFAIVSGAEVGGLASAALFPGQTKTSYAHVLKRNEAGKSVSAVLCGGAKISPLVFKEIRCAVHPKDRLKFNSVFKAAPAVTSIPAAQADQTVLQAEMPDLIDFDTVL